MRKVRQMQKARGRVKRLKVKKRLVVGTEDANLIDGVKGALVFQAGSHAGAVLGGLFPVFEGLQVLLPEGPGAALSGADGVDGAAATAGVVSHEKETVVALGSFLITEVPTVFDFIEVGFNEGGAGDLQVINDGLEFGGSGKDVAGGTGAAVTALGAGKVQAGGEPFTGVGGGARCWGSGRGCHG